MAFVHPSWFEGAMYFALWFLIPFILAIVFFVIGFVQNDRDYNAGGVALLVAVIFMILAVGCGTVGNNVAWHYQYELPSVDEKVITVDDWQPVFGKYWGEVNGANDLMLKTTDGELFVNQENFLFDKFATRDILDQLKPNGTYKIKYYGWREGYNDGCPNILSVEKVIDESKCPEHHDISNYMNKRSIIVEDNNW